MPQFGKGNQVYIPSVVYESPETWYKEGEEPVFGGGRVKCGFLEWGGNDAWFHKQKNGLWWRTRPRSGIAFMRICFFQIL